MAITHPTGFPLAANGDVSAENVTSYTMPHAYGSTNDIAIIGSRVASATVAITGIVGTKTGTWAQVAEKIGTATGFTVAIWIAPVTSTSGADVLTISYSGSVTTVYTSIWGDSLSAGGPVTWSIPAWNWTSSNSSVTTWDYPLLTSATTTNPQAYWGVSFPRQVNTGGSTSGFTYIDSPTNTGNEQVYNLSLASDTVYQPATNGTPAGNYDTVAIIIMAAPKVAGGFFLVP